MNTNTDTDYTTTTTTIAGTEVTVYGGTKRPVRTYATEGHCTGWMKRNGARTTYAELTCTCHLTGESRFPLGEGAWLTYGEDGWTETLNRLALAHITNTIERPYMIRPAGGDKSQVADRYRVTESELRAAMREHGMSGEDMPGTGVLSHLTAEDGTRFEVAR